MRHILRLPVDADGALKHWVTRDIARRLERIKVCLHGRGGFEAHSGANLPHRGGDAILRTLH